MSDHNKCCSCDDSWQKLAMPYDEFDIVISDVNEQQLVEIGRENENEHLSTASFSSSPFPLEGVIYGRNTRCMAPMVCQRANKPNSKALTVWFLIDTGSPFTCLSQKTLEAFLGVGNVVNSFYRFAIQDQARPIECHVSKAHFLEVNILGMDALQVLELSIETDWRRKGFKLVRK